MTEILTETVTSAPVAPAATTAPVPIPPLPHGEVGRIDPALSATAQRIADLQAQVVTLQQKLHSAEQRLAEAAERRTSPNIEVHVARNIGEKGLASYLNDGWGILHMQFVVVSEDDDQLHVVLQRMPPLPQPEQRPTVAATVAAPVAAPVPPGAPSINMPPIPRPQPARVVSGTLMSVDDNAAPLRTAVENYVHTILKDKTLTADERNQRLTEQAIANVRARAAERATAGAPLYRPITAMEMSL